MPPLNVLIETGEVCRCLRAKTLFYQPVGQTSSELAEAAASRPEGPFWCAITQSVIGVDGKFADVETCRTGRSCCEIA